MGRRNRSTVGIVGASHLQATTQCEGQSLHGFQGDGVLKGPILTVRHLRNCIRTVRLKNSFITRSGKWFSAEPRLNLADALLLAHFFQNRTAI